MQALESGNPVGPEDGIPIVETAVDVGETFGTGRASAAFADASTDSRLGVIYVVHNDGTGVEVARIDAQQGARVGEDHVVGGSFGCTVNGSPVLSPPAPDGSRILFFTLRA